MAAKIPAPIVALAMVEISILPVRVSEVMREAREPVILTSQVNTVVTHL